MKVLIVVAICTLVIFGAFVLTYAVPILRQRSYIAQLAAQRVHSLKMADEAYANGKPGMAAEHERTAEALLERIKRLEAGDASARIG